MKPGECGIAIFEILPPLPSKSCQSRILYTVKMPQQWKGKSRCSQMKENTDDLDSQSHCSRWIRAESVYPIGAENVARKNWEKETGSPS